MNSKKILSELKRRMGPSSGLFQAQRLAIEDPSRRKAYQTTRRGGKSWAGVVGVLRDLEKNPGTEAAYIALTRDQARGIIWSQVLKRIDREYSLNLTFKEARLRVELPNGSALNLYGADRVGWTDRLYGMKFIQVIIDEAAFYDSIDLEQFIGDIIDPTLADLRGSLILMSIPGRVRKGLFYEITHAGMPGWSVHKWSALDNPHMRQQFLDLIALKKLQNPFVELTPDFRRNYLGEWVLDEKDRVYAFDKSRNLSAEPKLDDPRYILGLDFGWDDKTAFSLCAYSPTNPTFYEIECTAERNKHLDWVVEVLESYAKRYPKNLTIVGDPSKRQLIEEIRRRFPLPIISAEKTDKLDWIEVVNGAFLGGSIKICPRAEAHVKELEELQWRDDARGVRKERQGQANDICDAFLYAFRMSYPYQFRQSTETPRCGTPAFYEAEERKIIDRLSVRSGEWWDS